jgi:rSAM/selenodomain-associated transferase 2
MMSPVAADGAFILRVSIIIPTINEAANIVGAIESASSAGADEIVVVDGGSNDETQAFVQARQDVIWLSSTPGRARQQNLGAQRASGDVLLFLHADCRLAGDSIAQIRQACVSDAIHWGAFQQRIDAEGFAYRVLERGNAWRVRTRGIAYGDQGLWIRRTLFEQEGGFADVPLLEDLLLAKSLRKLAWPMLLRGPLHVSARRWQRYGVVRQTIRNWGILTSHALGASPTELAKRYRRHDG